MIKRSIICTLLVCGVDFAAEPSLLASSTYQCHKLSHLSHDKLAERLELHQAGYFEYFCRKAHRVDCQDYNTVLKGYGRLIATKGQDENRCAFQPLPTQHLMVLGH